MQTGRPRQLRRIIGDCHFSAICLYTAVLPALRTARRSPLSALRLRAHLLVPVLAGLIGGLGCGAGHAAPLQSAHVIVVSDDTGQVLLSKDADSVVPIASLTKLMTAMVVLDSKPDMHEKIAILPADVNHYLDALTARIAKHGLV